MYTKENKLTKWGEAELTVKGEPSASAPEAWESTNIGRRDQAESREHGKANQTEAESVGINRKYLHSELAGALTHRLCIS
jgi:hypothetical protein